MIHLAMLIGTVAILIAVTVVLSRHERRQRETWLDDEPYERHVLDDE